jgi:long-chain acyl-CoA synthetase
MNLAQSLARHAQARPDATAVAVGKSAYATYGELARRAGALARALRQDMALAPGDRVVLFMANCPQYLEVLYACWFGGLVAVPVNAKLHHRELAFILENARAGLCFVTDALVQSAARATSAASPPIPVVTVSGQDYARLCAGEAIPPVAARPDDLAWLFYTSGTTGQPKGAMLSHRNLLIMAFSYLADIDALTTTDTLLHAAPMSHGSGLYAVPFMMQGGIQVIPESGGYDPGEVFEILSLYRDVSFFAAPTMVKRLVGRAHGKDPANLKAIIYGGAPMYVQDCRDALECFGPRLVQIYGQGESPMTITALSRGGHMDTTHPRYLDRLASVGVARTGVEVRVGCADDNPAKAGEIGEILVRGDTVMAGYWGNEEATRQTLRGGWLHTGDIGILDDDGFLTLKDRSKDVIISGGSNIYPREIEEVLLLHSEVTEVAVIGRDSPEWGEEVMAFVVRQPGSTLDASALDGLCLDHIARFKRPKDYVFVDALPKNNYGKVLKTKLREMAMLTPDTSSP